MPISAFFVEESTFFVAAAGSTPAERMPIAGGLRAAAAGAQSLRAEAASQNCRAWAPDFAAGHLELADG
ncbi:MAG: hypothetical protein E5V65_18765 [Mesorhizobium sp.]|nr:MAG: hypothetical protein E5V65_18765 [Mesorhizobium sp.]